MPAERVTRGRPARTLVMGVLNVTPDSFSDAGRFLRAEDALEQGLRLAEEGADFVDVGGESTRPGSDPVSEQEELDRVAPVVEGLARRIGARISIDTYKVRVAEECLRLGATLVNDVTGLADAAMARAVKAHGAGVVVMHMRGKPKTMQQDVVYDDVVTEVRAFLDQRARVAREAGIEEVIVDPGIGFGKTAAHNFEIIRRLEEIVSLGHPVMVGPSRKSFLGSLASKLPSSERLEGTLAAVAVSVLHGAAIVRVHDVLQAKRVVEVVDAVQGG